MATSRLDAGLKFYMRTTQNIHSEKVDLIATARRLDSLQPRRRREYRVKERSLPSADVHDCCKR